MIFQPGTTLVNGKYRVEAYLGQGASARVYRAMHLRLKQMRALKVLRRDAPGVGSTEFGDFRQRFQLEAQLGAKVNNDNVIQIFDFEESDGALMLAMEYAPGGSLNDRMAHWRERNQPMPVEEAIGILIDSARGIAAVHAQDAVHRDLKPTNILIDADGHAKVADLGLAQIPGGPSMRSQLSTAQPHPGTPAYMSPEQERSGAYLGPSSDIYALGLIAFEMLTGRAYRNVRPGTRVTALRKDVPAELDNLVARMLDEDPRKRPFNGEELLAELNGVGVTPQWTFVQPPGPVAPVEVAEQTPVRSTAAPTPATAPSVKKTLRPQNRLVVAGGLGGLILAGVIGIALLANSGAFRGAAPAPTSTSTVTAMSAATPTVAKPTASATATEIADTPTPETRPTFPVRCRIHRNRTPHLNHQANRSHR